MMLEFRHQSGTLPPVCGNLSDLPYFIVVADAVEAMSSHRPYRPGLGMDAALAEITGASGVRYDQQTVEACIRLIREKGFTFKAD
ncbi:MAG: hypothetical protein NUV75_12865 [Gallionella sp.]|nr:hypothetical protein [Gallionella sp.]